MIISCLMFTIAVNKKQYFCKTFRTISVFDKFLWKSHISICSTKNANLSFWGGGGGGGFSTLTFLLYQNVEKSIVC